MSATIRKPPAQTKSDPLPISLIRRAREFGGQAYGSPIAVMLMLRELTDEQFRAASDYQRAYRDYLAAIDAKQVRTAKLEFGSVGTPPDADSSQGRSTARHDAVAVSRYNERYRIVASCGVDAARDFEAVVCAELTPTWIMKITVARVAQALASTKTRRDARGDKRSKSARAC